MGGSRLVTGDAQDTKKGPLAAIQRAVDRSRLAALLLSVAAIVGALVTINTGARGAASWYDRQFRLTERTEELLESLRPNVTADEFDRRLGAPRVVTPSETRLTTQRLYQGPGYWVQAVVDESGTVLWFAVTVCSNELEPSWRVWNSRDAYIEVQMHRTKVASSKLPASGYVWNIPGATANQFIYAIYSGGNPTNYQQYAWGYNDACDEGGDPFQPELSQAEFDAVSDHYSSSAELGEDEGSRASTIEPVSELPPALDVAFRRVRANTFAIFGVHQPEEGLEHEFQIGADRILTRTLADDG